MTHPKSLCSQCSKAKLRPGLLSPRQCSSCSPLNLLTADTTLLTSLLKQEINLLVLTYLQNLSREHYLMWQMVMTLYTRKTDLGRCVLITRNVNISLMNTLAESYSLLSFRFNVFPVILQVELKKKC